MSLPVSIFKMKIKDTPLLLFLVLAPRQCQSDSILSPKVAPMLTHFDPFNRRQSLVVGVSVSGNRPIGNCIAREKRHWRFDFEKTVIGPGRSNAKEYFKNYFCSKILRKRGIGVYKYFSEQVYRYSFTTLLLLLLLITSDNKILLSLSFTWKILNTDRIIIFTIVNSKTTTTWVFLDGMTVAARFSSLPCNFLLLIISYW